MAADLLALGAIVLACRPRQGWRRCVFSAALAGGILAAAAVGAGLLGARWHAGFAAHYDTMFGTNAFSFLEKSALAGERICVFAARSYPFAGSRRQSLMLQLHKTAAQREKFRSCRQVLEFLRTHRATIVAVPRGAPYWHDLGVGSWAERHPEVLRTIQQSGRFTLLRVNGELLTKLLRHTKHNKEVSPS